MAKSKSNVVALQGKLAVDAGAKPQLRAKDKRSWTKTKEQAFLTALAETCNVKHSAKAAGVAPSTVYARRGRDAAFRAGWDQALAIGYAQLEMMMLERALHGVDKIVIGTDGKRTVMKDYSDRVGLALLRMHRDSAGLAEEGHDEEEVAEAAERILARLKAIGERSENIETKARAGRIGLIAWALKA